MKNLMNCPIINSALSFFMKLAFHSSPIEAIMPRKNTVIHRFLLGAGFFHFVHNMCTDEETEILHFCYFRH